MQMKKLERERESMELAFKKEKWMPSKRISGKKVNEFLDGNE